MKFSNLSIFFALLFITFACKTKDNKAEQIIDDVIASYGGKAYENLNVKFNFREKAYQIVRNGNEFSYTRTQIDNDGKKIVDQYSNTSFTRTVNGKTVFVADSMVTKYQNSINSVAYFTLLPRLLQDKAVQKEYLGQTNIGAEPYHKIKVTFASEGGGKDHQDQYIYWFHVKNKTMDYFAYSYETDGGGVRFREKIRDTTVAGVRFQDYINYAPKNETAPVATMDSLFMKGELIEFSRIENKFN